MDLQDLVDELDRLAEEAEQLQEEIDELEGQAQELEDADDAADLKRSWELWAESFETSGRMVRIWAEWTAKSREYNDANGTLTEETAELFEEVEELYGEWAEHADRGEEVATQIAALYEQDEVDDADLERLGGEIEEIDAKILEAYEAITAKEEEIEEETPEASLEEEDEDEE